MAMQRRYGLLIIWMLFVLLGGSNAQAETITCGDYGYSENADGTITLESYTGNDTEVTVSAQLDGKTVSGVAEGIFSSCQTITSFLVEADHTTLSSVDGVLYDIDHKVLLAFPRAKAVTSYSVPEGTEGIRVRPQCASSAKRSGGRWRSGRVDREWGWILFVTVHPLGEESISIADNYRTRTTHWVVLFKCHNHRFCTVKLHKKNHVNRYIFVK